MTIPGAMTVGTLTIIFGVTLAYGFFRMEAKDMEERYG